MKEKEGISIRLSDLEHEHFTQNVDGRVKNMYNFTAEYKYRDKEYLVRMLLRFKEDGTNEVMRYVNTLPPHLNR